MNEAEKMKKIAKIEEECDEIEAEIEALKAQNADGEDIEILEEELLALENKIANDDFEETK